VNVSILDLDSHRPAVNLDRCNRRSVDHGMPVRIVSLKVHRVFDLRGRIGNRNGARTVGYN
jgi:hypothetical protein